MKRLVVIAAAGFLAGRFSAQLPPVLAQSPETEVLMKADADFDLAVSRGGAPAWAGYFAPDGRMIRQNGEVVEGRAAIEKQMTPLFSNPANSLRWRPQIADIAASGDLGYTIGESTLRITGQDGKLLEGRGRYLTVWKKQPDGSWKVAVDIGSGDPPKPVAQ